MAETPVVSTLLMDRSEPLGNSLDESGRRALHVVSQGGVLQVRGLSIAGRITMVTLSHDEWTPVPAVPLIKRNSLLLQNVSNKTVIWNYSNSADPTAGFQILVGGYKEVAITDSIHVYARLYGSGSGTAEVVVEELS